MSSILTFVNDSLCHLICLGQCHVLFSGICIFKDCHVLKYLCVFFLSFLSYLHNKGKTKGAGQSTFELNNLDILTDGYFQSIYSSDVIHNPPITMVTMPSLSLKLNDSLKMHPGGTIDVSYKYIKFKNILT